jgi:hypothetical protein
MAEKSAAKQVRAEIALPRMNLQAIDITVIGDSPYISHKWSDRIKQKMLAKMLGQADVGREPKDPEREFEESIYRMADGTPAIPVMAFKRAITSAGRFVQNLKMTEIRGAVHLVSHGELLPIQGAAPEMREDVVRVNNSAPDIRYRAQFKDWRVKLTVKFNANAISAEEVVNLFRVAGFAVGVGDWRPECNGPFGTFRLAEAGD